MLTLRTRLIVLYSGLLTGLVALGLLGSFRLLHHRALMHLDTLLEEHFTIIKTLLHHLTPPYHSADVAMALHQYLQYQAPQLYVQIHTDNEWVFFRTTNLGNATLPDLTWGIAQEGQKVNIGTMRISEKYLDRLHIQLALPLEGVAEVQEQFHALMLWILPVVFGVSQIFGFLMSQQTLRPLRMIQSTARQISASQLNHRIPLPKGSNELRDLAKMLNGMFDRLEHAFHQLQRFTADAAHELRMPLTMIRLHSERLLQRSDLSAVAKLTVEDQLHEVHRLHAIIDRLLLLARAEAHTLPLQRGLHAVETFIKEFAEDAEVLAEERDIQFLVACCDRGEAAFDPAWIRQVLFNMLNNSLKFSPEGSTITLYSTLSADTWSFEMTDEGPGIPPAYLPHIFDRFVQVDPQSELRSGSGLGLAICKSLVELHQGHLECANRTYGHGLVVRCTLPRMLPA